MQTVLVTGSSGLIGSESVRYFCDLGFHVVGIDNDMRSYFFGKEASTKWKGEELKNTYPNFSLETADIRDQQAISDIFRKYQGTIELIIHAAAQPSHDWAAKEPFTDFSVNANGTLNLLEATRQFAPDSVFIFTSTNKVYGDRPNSLPLVELEDRWEIDTAHSYFTHGISEDMSIDQTLHSIFGASKVAADILVQEYGRYFNMKTGIFRGGCLTGPNHSGAELHGFLAYLMKCAVSGKPYTIFGYKGKQVRDNIHSNDLVSAFYHFYKNPRVAEVYNIGGGRFSNCSMKEAIQICERITGKAMNISYSEDNRVGDHIWWISDISKFEHHYPDWSLKYNVEAILNEMYGSLTQRMT